MASNDYNAAYSQLERVVKNIINKMGLQNNQHEISEVAFDQTAEGTVQVQSLFSDGKVQEIPCVIGGALLKAGDKVLVQYLNRDDDHKVVIGAMSRNINYSEIDNSIDYNNLPVRPMRVYREDVPYSYNDSCCRKGSTTSGKCPDVPRVYKIVYGEGTRLEWSEEYVRNSKGLISSIITYLPPSYSIKIVDYIVRDDKGFLMEYYGPSAIG